MKHRHYPKKQQCYCKCCLTTKRRQALKSKEYLKKLEWDSAIAAATIESEANKQNPTPEAYLTRGIARCFKDGKDGKYDDAIEDLSRAISLAKAAGAEKAAEDARYYRAYAYYLNGDYANALHDCRKCPQKPEKYELLGTTYLAISKYEESARYFDKALRMYTNENKIPNPGLLNSYRNARKRLNSL